MSPKQFIILLKNANCLVGNSSAGIKECSYLGTPVVNVGTRQNNRLREKNVIDVVNDKDKIKKAVKKQLSKGNYKPSNLYYSNNTSRNIAKTLATVNLYIQKSFVG
jgi:UDP-N-acetylglucosamine 2-epimerase